MGQLAADDDTGTHVIYRTRGYRRSSPADFGRGNASACVAACFAEFVPNLEDACHQLQQAQYRTVRLWDLYCCDSLNCGVYIETAGQSPNVDLIINKCQNIGFSSIEDPGPPSTGYCASVSMLGTAVAGTSPQTSVSSLPAFRTWSADPASSYTTTTTFARTSAVPLATTSALLSDSKSTGQGSAGLPGGVKAAIGIFSTLAALAAIACLLLILRKRRKGPKKRYPAPLLIPFGNSSYCEPNSGSQAPLIAPPPPSPSRNSPLTPPAKLSDRKYLHPAMKSGTPRSSAASSIGNAIIAPSPFISTHSKLIPQHERRVTTGGIRAPAAKSVPATTSHHPQGSVYSLSSGLGTSTVTVASNKASSVHSGSVTVMGAGTPPLSPTKLPHPRPQADGPLESPDLVTPAGPPPKRALPLPPSNHPNSPTFSLSPVSPLSPTFPPRILTRGDSPIVPGPLVGSASDTPPPPPPTVSTSTSTSTKELCELTESYARETRESWGSWSGVGGGGPGVNPLRRKRGSVSPLGSPVKKAENGGAPPVPLQELDLEKLCGRYGG
ncbi:hypothetical protein F5Y17DRAFT_88427 [Xylariaceae sp. FL0594]|nr:hypothetical protein F5Y17DRAFT_88427 [Xylariaceae sp. FL0594]